MNIEFFTENISLPDLDSDKVRRWIVEVAQSYGFSVGRLGYCFCDDDYILESNRKYLGHDYYTDIITFDYTRNQKINGDMIISLDTVRSNGELSGDGYDRELLRVVIHGVLHLVGINDKGEGEREIMEAAENRALCLWDNMD